MICDRYAWDELANLNLCHSISRLYARLIARIVPRPDVSYLLDADPILARARKPEYPLDFLYRCREAYLRLDEIVRCLAVIPPGPIQEVEAGILKHLLLDDVEPPSPPRESGVIGFVGVRR